MDIIYIIIALLAAVAGGAIGWLAARKEVAGLSARNALLETEIVTRKTAAEHCRP